MTEKTAKFTPNEKSVNDDVEDEVINASGHKQEVERNFGIWSICGAGITTGSDWPALGGSLVDFAPLRCNAAREKLTWECLLSWWPYTMVDLQASSTSCMADTAQILFMRFSAKRHSQLRGFRVLLVRGGNHRRNGQCYTIQLWGLPLGFCRWRP